MGARRTFQEGDEKLYSNVYKIIIRRWTDALEIQRWGRMFILEGELLEQLWLTNYTYQQRGNISSRCDSNSEVIASESLENTEEMYIMHICNSLRYTKTFRNGTTDLCATLRYYGVILHMKKALYKHVLLYTYKSVNILWSWWRRPDSRCIRHKSNEDLAPLSGYESYDAFWNDKKTMTRIMVSLELYSNDAVK